MVIKFRSFLLSIPLAVSATFIKADEVKFYDQVPSIDDLQRQLLGVEAGANTPKNRIQRKRSFQVDGDDIQQADDSSKESRPSIGAVRIEFSNKSDAQSSQIAPVIVNTVSSALAFPINFDNGSAQLRLESLRYLDSIAELMKKNTVSILVEGHTDASGNENINYRLSRERAYSVINYLVDQHGIHPARLSAMGVGSKQILSGEAPNSTKNRRVQIRVRPS